MFRLRILVLLLVLFLAGCTASQDSKLPEEGDFPQTEPLLVPQDFATLAAALAASEDGDTILIAPGTYAGRLAIDRRVVVASQGGQVIIESTLAPLVMLAGSAGAVVEGITFRSAGDVVAAIDPSASGVTLRGITLLGTGPATKGLLALGVNGLVLQNCQMTTSDKALDCQGNDLVIRNLTVHLTAALDVPAVILRGANRALVDTVTVTADPGLVMGTLSGGITFLEPATGVRASNLNVTLTGEQLLGVAANDLTGAVFDGGLLTTGGNLSRGFQSVDCQNITVRNFAVVSEVGGILMFAINLNSVAGALVENCQVAAGPLGAGIRFQGVQDVVVRSNQVVAGAEGITFFDYAGVLAVENTVFGGFNGIAFNLANASAISKTHEVIRCHVIATTGGGGAGDVGPALSYRNCIFENCPFGVFTAGTPVLAENCVISGCDNAVTSFSGDPIVLVNCILANNQATFAGAVFGDFNLLFNNLDGALPLGPNGFVADPMLNADFTLAGGSPAIDAGDPGSQYFDVIPPGQGTSRNDIGAFGGPDAGRVGAP
ncbi:MAG: hypothetical protein AB7S38_11630 [Vulcanimicrobiota bacterium]